MADLQGFFRGFYYALSAGVAQEWADTVESELVQYIRGTAPEGMTDHLERSIRKELGPSEMEWFVEAGGDLTTKESGGKPYDYVMATEFGTQHEPAHPFFWPTVRARRPVLVRRAEEILTSRFAKL